MSKKVIVALGGGLGNQFFQVTAASFALQGNHILLDQSLGQPRLDKSGKPEVLNFRFPKELVVLNKLKFALFPRKCVGYNLRMNVSPRSYEKINFVKVLIENLTSAVIRIFFAEKYSLEACKGLGFYEMLKREEPILMSGYFQSYRWAEKELSKEVSKGVHLIDFSSVFSDLLEQMRKDAPVIIHIRRGDYLNEDNFGILSDDYYSKALTLLSQKMNISKIWLFTDSPESILESIPQDYRTSCFIVPADKVSASETLELMRHGAAYIIANSSFSWWGAYLRMNHGAPVFAPVKWFKGMDDPDELIPPDWQIVPLNNPFR